jgi:hypothetical protein
MRLSLDWSPFSLKILLESLPQFEDGVNVTPSKGDALLNHYQWRLCFNTTMRRSSAITLR